MRLLGASAVLSVGLVACLAAPVAAQESPEPQISLRAFTGIGTGVGVQVWGGGWVRADLSVSSVILAPFDWASAGVVVRLVGSQRTFLGLRGGYQLEYNGDDQPGWMGSRTTHALDVSLVARTESARGSAFEVQAGGEELFRSSKVVCCDNAALPTRSTGLRLAVTGELALSNELALFAQAELRTGAHVMEITWFPSASAGVRYRF